MYHNSNLANTTALSEMITESSMDELANSYTQISCTIGWSTLISCLVGLFSNLLSMIIFSRPTMRKTPINLLLLGMSAVDFALCILALFVFVVPEFFGCYKLSTLLLISSYAFVYVYPLTSAAQTASTWLFLVVSYERWNAVCGGPNGRVYRPAPNGSRSGDTRSQKQAIAAVILVIILSIAYNLVRFFEFHVVLMPGEEDDTILVGVKGLLKDEENPYYYLYMKVYYIALFLLTHFAGPFFILVCVNGMIIRTIYVARLKRRQLLTRKEKKEHRTSLMMAIVISMFLLCHTVPFVLNVIEAIDPQWFWGDSVALAYALNDVSNLIVVANAAAASLIYYHFNRAYHDMCIQYFCHGIRRKWLPTRTWKQGSNMDESLIFATEMK